MYVRFIEEGTNTLVYSASVNTPDDYKHAVIHVEEMGYDIIGKSDDSTKDIVKFIVRKRRYDLCRR